jgi:NAD(P)-dependent dehydrogenase (short-subunit alcohol dehydrogenase family)
MFDLSLSGKTGVVSGSTAGIGFAAATALAALGARVVITGRSAERVDAAVAELRSAGRDAVGVAGDLTTAAAAEHMASAIH